MLIRIWRTGFDTTRLPELQQFADDVSGPMFRSFQGCMGYVFAVDGSTWITQTFWESADHLEKAEASDDYRRVVERIGGIGVLEGDQTTEVFEITTYRALPPLAD
jgi:quinol monooxygenase YgiN